MEETEQSRRQQCNRKYILSIGKLESIADSGILVPFALLSLEAPFGLLTRRKPFMQAIQSSAMHLYCLRNCFHETEIYKAPADWVANCKNTLTLNIDYFGGGFTI